MGASSRWRATPSEPRSKASSWLSASLASTHHRAGAVAEEDGGVAVLLVGEPAHGLGADEQDPVEAHGDERVGVHQPVDEARAGGVEVECAPPAIPSSSWTCDAVEGTW